MCRCGGTYKLINRNVTNVKKRGISKVRTESTWKCDKCGKVTETVK
jgi:hypothetical protein